MTAGSGSSFSSRFKKDENDSNSDGGGLASRFKDQFDKRKSDRENLSSTLGDKKSAGDNAKDIISKRKAKKDENFADQTKKKDSSLFLVRGRDRGKHAWHYVVLHKSKRDKFLVDSRKGAIDVSEYGKIVSSGWGKDPPEDIKKEMEALYG